STSRQPILVLVRRAGAVFRRYAPLKEPLAMYRIFAETPASPEGVLAFANRYGMLFSEKDRKPYCWPRARSGPVGETLGERLDAAERVELVDDWIRRIWFAAETVDLWDLARNRETQELGRRIKWSGKRAVYFVPKHQEAF